MVEKLNSTVISALKACTSTPKDWVNCLQSVAMSIRSQPHESTGLSPYEMMFGVPMRLPTELEDGDIPEKATQTELAHIMPQPPQGHDGAKIFESVDKIRQIIHNSASGNISRAKTKQAFYFEQRHRGIPLQIGDKVLHYNKRAGQRMGDKLEGRWLGPYIIVGMTGKQKYQVKDSNGYVLKTYLNGSNLKRYLTKDDVNTDDPDLVPVGELPDAPNTVDDLLASINYEKTRPKSKGGKKRKTGDVHLLFPDPQSYKRSKKDKGDMKQNVTQSPPAKPIGDNRSEEIPPSSSEIQWREKKVKIITPSKDPHTRKEKNNFLNSMVANVKNNLSPLTEQDDEVQMVAFKKECNYIFTPLTVQQRRVICERTSLVFRKAELNFSNINDTLGTRSPKVRAIKGDGNCFFRAVSVGLTGWEVGHLKIRQLVCDHIISYGPCTKEAEGKVYINQKRMKTNATYATDVEIMAAAQIFGIDIYVYHTYGNSLKWLKFPCRHNSPTSCSNAIYLDNRHGNGTNGHFDFVTGLF